MNSCMNLSDTLYFDYLLRLAIVDAAGTSDLVTIPEPPITSYDPVYYPTQSSMFPDITTFNSVDQMFDFDFAFSLIPTTLNDTLLDSSNKRCKQQEVVAKPVFPENTGLTTLFDFGSVDLDHDTLPSNPEPERGHIQSISTKPSKQTKVVTRRPRRAALRLRYSSYEQRLKTLAEDPFVRAIMEDENKVLCAGCGKDIQLDNRRRRSLHLQNWATHKDRCAGISQCRRSHFQIVFGIRPLLILYSQLHESLLRLGGLGFQFAPMICVNRS